MMKSPLKWAGGKTYLLGLLAKHLSGHERLIEPFVGSGTVFLGLNYDTGVVADINQDLITLYRAVRDDTNNFIDAAYALWKNNDKEEYLQVRAAFNEQKLPTQFLYLNRHSFNGLCRYNQKGGFNVPWGQYARPYFPDTELRFLAHKIKGFETLCSDFLGVMRMATPGSVVYCDPPYTPINKTSNFTGYSADGFGMAQHEVLAAEAERLHALGIKVVISNNDTELTRKLYAGATEIIDFDACRSVAGNGDHRRKEKELIAIYS